jgi:iron only hydrogenase large subunit-like protein
VKAINMTETFSASIDNSKCVSCGACVYQCPWGAIMDKSFVLNAIDILKKSASQNFKAYAVVAPSIASQFAYAKLGQAISGIKALGFHAVVEAALGADMVASAESEELAEKGFLLSSCCPAFVDHVAKEHPGLLKSVSKNLSPAATIAKWIKSSDKSAKVVFIGPCTAKKMEFQKVEVRPCIDCVITFEELQALFDSRGIDIASLPLETLDNASFYGRIFARSGGLSEAVAQALKERGIDFALKAAPCDGIEECRAACLKASRNLLDANFIEGMACVGGCIGGAGCLTHGEKNRREVDKYGREALEKNILDAISVLGQGR